MRNGESPSVTVVRAIAIREGVDPVELDPPLHEVVDPSALNCLFQENGRSSDHLALEFTYDTYRVRVTGTDPEVEVTER
ncbi:hypothetical protein SAMN05444422_101408 [Halobiforma haloterrestris]|uniref:Halobacterial output domain-containing protein n=1 Tax=Natronobacterium haloterrestre TaxID=148448 RepID=A0A1I1D8W0_NATHA|nr:HalOD1 output domain-containing protein [Halobiforma haloterrestris]SFB71365.1 hypothetical protein SAMN05444422_101408 [Halobiforma haloterrestris]